MPHKFLLLEMLGNYDVVQNELILDPVIKNKLIKDLKKSNIEFVHVCTDTSADKALREYSQNKPFATYFLVGINIDSTADDKATMTSNLAKYIKKCDQGSLVDISSTYQVITFY